MMTQQEWAEIPLDQREAEILENLRRIRAAGLVAPPQMEEELRAIQLRKKITRYVESITDDEERTHAITLIQSGVIPDGVYVSEGDTLVPAPPTIQ